VAHDARRRPRLRGRALSRLLPGSERLGRNLEASHTARLTQRGHVEEIEVEDVPVTERVELLDVYRDRYGKMPTVGSA